jgi:hypothetical protein
MTYGGLISPRVGTLIFAFGSARDKSRDLPTTVPTTFVDYLKTLPEDAQWALRDINSTDDGRTLVQAIRDGTAIGISDGSFKDGFGTASCNLTKDGRTIAQAIRDGTAIGISDGSFKNGFGTASWVLKGPQHNQFVLPLTGSVARLIQWQNELLCTPRVTEYAGTVLSQATRRIKVPIAANSQACIVLH